MSEKMENLVEKYVDYLKGYDSDDMVSNGAQFMHNSWIYNSNPNLSKDELCYV
jgi:hypothetical protein